MKKIVSLIFILFLLILIIPKSFANNSSIEIESIELDSKSDNTIEFYKPTIDNMNLNFDLGFSNVEDNAKYKVVIKNNTNKDYYIDNENKFNDSNYITYTYDFPNNTTKIEKNSNITMYLTVKYNKQVPIETLSQGLYTENNSMSVDLSDVILTNPNTYSNLIVFILIISILIILTILKIKKKQRIGFNVLLIVLLLIPITTYALERITIKAETKISIEEKRNILSNHIVDNYINYYDCITTITFDTKIEEPSNTVHSYDVSAAQDNSIIAYLTLSNVPAVTSSSSTTYDLYIKTNGYIYGNPDSSYLFSIGGFLGSIELQEINNLDYLKTNYVENMSGMFRGIQRIKELDLSSFDTSNVTDMSDMFYTYWMDDGYSELEKLDLSSFNTSKVTNMSNMFGYQRRIEELDLSSFDTSNVTNMSNMFSDCRNLKSINLNSFNTSKVTNIRSMFTWCSELEELDLSMFEINNILDLSSMFSNCRKLKTLDISNFNTNQTTNMSYMFNNDENLETVYVGNEWNTDNVTTNNSYNMFYNCRKLPNFISFYIDKTNANTSSTGYLTLKS